MGKFVIKSSFKEIIIGFVIYFLPAFLINLIPFLWLRMLSFAIFATALVALALYGTIDNENVVEFKDSTCLNKAFKTECHNENTPIKLGGDEPPKGFKFGDF